ncbi:MAG: hypothetical protein HOE80_02995 [Candidatus Magasanikbacteria bacterium]|jgi:preprotein translocase subunit SecY|nr:hypothetical protein [Candidatus Magasanikbacteria bacterium]MBT4071666.1 hypothetical protein [Candidatus Magasanikbacteria bacterium]
MKKILFPYYYHKKHSFSLKNKKGKILFALFIVFIFFALREFWDYEMWYKQFICRGMKASAEEILFCKEKYSIFSFYVIPYVFAQIVLLFYGIQFIFFKIILDYKNAWVFFKKHWDLLVLFTIIFVQCYLFYKGMKRCSNPFYDIFPRSTCRFMCGFYIVFLYVLLPPVTLVSIVRTYIKDLQKVRYFIVGVILSILLFGLYVK